MQARPCSSAFNISFEKKLVNVDPDLTTLYRGFEDMLPMMHTLPVILGGLFGHYFPREVTIWDVRNHKTTNLSPEYYFSAMTSSLEVAKLRGQGNFIAIDPALFRSRIFDVNKSFSRRSLTLSNTTMSDEAEQVALAIPYCAIQSLHLQDLVIANPFYISDPAAAAAFAEIYDDYLRLLHAKFNHALTASEEEQWSREYVSKYMNFYIECCGCHNPFLMTIHEFAARHPHFGGPLLKQHLNARSALFQKHETLSEVVERFAGKVFSSHPYCQNIPTERAECTTVYDDEYARPHYE